MEAVSSLRKKFLLSHRPEDREVGPYIYHLTDEQGAVGILRDDRLGFPRDDRLGLPPQPVSLTSSPLSSPDGRDYTWRLVLDFKKLLKARRDLLPTLYKRTSRSCRLAVTTYRDILKSLGYRVSREIFDHNIIASALYSNEAEWKLSHPLRNVTKFIVRLEKNVARRGEPCKWIQQGSVKEFLQEREGVKTHAQAWNETNAGPIPLRL